MVFGSGRFHLSGMGKRLFLCRRPAGTSTVLRAILVTAIPLALITNQMVRKHGITPFLRVVSQFATTDITLALFHSFFSRHSQSSSLARHLPHHREQVPVNYFKVPAAMPAQKLVHGWGEPDHSEQPGSTEALRRPGPYRPRLSVLPSDGGEESVACRAPILAGPDGLSALGDVGNLRLFANT